MAAVIGTETVPTFPEILERREVPIERDTHGVEDRLAVRCPHLVADHAVRPLGPAQLGDECTERLGTQGHAVLERADCVGLHHHRAATRDSRVWSPMAQPVVLGRRANDPADQTMRPGRARGIGQHDADRPRPAGHGGHRLLEHLHPGIAQHALDGLIHNRARRLARHDQAGPDLAELDGIGHLEEGVHDAKARVARVVHDSLAADTQGVGGGARGGGLQVVATHPAVDKHPNLVRRDPSRRQRLAAGSGRAVGHTLTGIPEATLSHAGQCRNLA